MLYCYNITGAKAYGQQLYFHLKLKWEMIVIKVNLSTASEEERIFIASNTRNKKIIAKLAKDDSEKVLIELIANSRVSNEILEELTLHGDLTIRELAKKQLDFRKS